MGGDSGGGTTTSHAEIAPEFRPIVTGTSNQLLALQSQLPLTSFIGNDPQTIPGLAPMQQEALRYAGAMTKAPTGLDAMMAYGNPLNQASQSLMNMSGYDSIAPYRDPMGGIAEALFSSASSPGSLAGRQAAFDVLSNSGRVAPVTLSDGGGSSSSYREMFSGARGSGGGGAPTPAQFSFGGPPSGNGFQFNSNALDYTPHEAGGIANPYSMAKLGPQPWPPTSSASPQLTGQIAPEVMQQIVAQLPQSFPTLRPTGEAANPGRWRDGVSGLWVDGTGNYWNEYGDIATGDELRSIPPY